MNTTVRTALRYAVVFVITVISTYVLGAVTYTQFVLAGLQQVGAEVPLDVRIGATLHDLVGLANPASNPGETHPSYLGFIFLTLLIAYPIAFAAKSVVRPLAPFAYPIAGAAAMAATLRLYDAQSGTLWPAMPGAADPMGFAAQCLAGAAGGALFFFLERASARWTTA